MAAPYYLAAPKGDEYQPSFFEKLSNGINNMPSESFYNLASALATPGPWAQRLTAGLAGFGSPIAAQKKKQGLAAAFDQLLPTIPEAQRPIFAEMVKNDPQALMGALSTQMFAKPNEPTSDIQNYQFAVQQGFPGTYFDFKKQLAQAQVTPLGVDVPGVGTIDPKTGAPMAPSAPPPQAMPSPSRGAPVPPPASVIAPDSPGQFFNPDMHKNTLGDGMMPPEMQGPPPLNAADFPPAPAPTAPLRPILDPQAKLLNLGAPPQGQMWVYGADGKTPTLQSVPGYKAPAGQVPAEVGARIGLAEGFLKRFDQIKKRLPELDSIQGRGQILFNTGIGAEVKRYIESGAEALIRSLTGAGKSQEEARSYASRYLPHPLDTDFDLNSKLEGLKYDLENSISGTMSDRGGWQSPAKEPEPSKEDLEFTAKKYGISVEEVKRRLKNAN